MKVVAALIFFMSSTCLAAFIAWGSTNATVPLPVGQHFLMGFQLGMETVGGKKLFKKYVRIFSDESKSQIAALKVANEAAHDGAAALVGFPGSHDSLLAARVAEENKISAIFPGCIDQDLANYGSFVRSTGHAGTEEVMKSIWFISKHLKGRGLVIVNPAAVVSYNIGQLFMQKKPYARKMGVTYTIADLDSRLEISDEDMEKLKKHGFGYIVFVPYPYDMQRFTNQLMELGIDIPVLAGAAWGTVDSDVMRRYVASKKAPFYMMTTWNARSSSGRAFIRKFKAEFAKKPSPDSAYGYDLGIIVGRVLKLIKGPLTKKSFAATLNSHLCFNGLSVGRLCLSKTGGHTRRTIYFLKYSSRGFRLFDSSR